MVADQVGGGRESHEARVGLAIVVGAQNAEELGLQELAEHSHVAGGLVHGSDLAGIRRSRTRAG